MAAEGKTSRNPLDNALVDRSRGTPKARDTSLDPAKTRLKRAHGARTHGPDRPPPHASAMTKTELDDIYSLAPDDGPGEVMKRRRVFTKARTDLGDAKMTSLYVSGSAATGRVGKSNPSFTRSVSDSGTGQQPTSRKVAPAASAKSSSRQVNARGRETPALGQHDAPRPRPDCESIVGPSILRAPLLGADEGSTHVSVPSPRVSSPSRPNPAAKGSKTGRVRLIDRLAAQAEESSDSESETGLGPQFTYQENGAKAFLSAAEVPTTPLRANSATVPKGHVQSANRTNVKTYSQQRSFRAESESHKASGGAGYGLDASLGFGNLAAPSKFGDDSFAFDDEDMDEARPKSGILGLHALRQAGANHRVSNDLSDLFERIDRPQPQGSPSARSRRIALLELGRKFHDKKFVASFCDDASHETIFRDIGREEDVINGFVLLSAFIMVLAYSSSSHLLDQVYGNGIDKLFDRMIEVDEDITHVGRQKQSNLSKQGRVSLEALRSAVLQASSIWGTASLSELSPRTLGLQALAMSFKQGNSLLNTGVIATLAPSLFNVVATGKATLASGKREFKHLLDLRLSLSLLQGSSMTAMESKNSTEWLTRCLPSISSILPIILTLLSPDLDEVESQALKLAMNASNNPHSAEILGADELLRSLSQAAVSRFNELHNNISEDRFPEGLYGRLILVLGVLINVTEHHAPARARFSAWTEGTSPFGGLITVYLDHRESSGKAESYEQTSLAVAHGYLAILLGYVSLDRTSCQSILQRSQGRGLQYLLGSIREFMVLHNKVTDTTTDDMMTSLVQLVNMLQVKANKVAAQ